MHFAILKNLRNLLSISCRCQQDFEITKVAGSTYLELFFCCELPKANEFFMGIATWRLVPDLEKIGCLILTLKDVTIYITLLPDQSFSLKLLDGSICREVPIIILK